MALVCTYVEKRNVYGNDDGQICSLPKTTWFCIPR